MPCEWIKERKYFRFVYYRVTFWVKCVIWPWFQVYFLRRRIVRWKMTTKIDILNPDHEIRITIEGAENDQKEVNGKHNASQK